MAWHSGCGKSWTRAGGPWCPAPSTDRAPGPSKRRGRRSLLARIPRTPGVEKRLRKLGNLPNKWHRIPFGGCHGGLLFETTLGSATDLTRINTRAMAPLADVAIARSGLRNFPQAGEAALRVVRRVEREFQVNGRRDRRARGA